MAADPLADALSEEFYNEVMDQGSITKDWVIIKTPLLLSVLAAYLLAVVLGPRLMHTRAPFQLTSLLRLYNLFQVLHNGYIVYNMIAHNDALIIAIKMSCTLGNHQQHNDIKPLFLTYGWHFLVSKMLDLLDTVFFMLRKKNSHLTFLHVYHHTLMVVITWTCFRYIKPIQSLFPASINVVVHTIMYSYYFLATFPQLKPYLWWKRHLTRLQLAQFLVVICYLSWLYFNDCQISKVYTYLAIPNVGIFLCLFINFYIKAYVVKAKKSS